MFDQVIYFSSKNALQKPVIFGLLKQAPALRLYVKKSIFSRCFKKGANI